jgi:uncharacterized OB-fold protein
MLRNLDHIREQGIRHFIKLENTRWQCAACGSLLCMHRPNCLNCGAKNKKDFT